MTTLWPYMKIFCYNLNILGLFIGGCIYLKYLYSFFSLASKIHISHLNFIVMISETTNALLFLIQYWIGLPCHKILRTPMPIPTHISLCLLQSLLPLRDSSLRASFLPDMHS